MSDVVRATALLDEVIGYRGVRENKSDMLERAYRLLSQHNPKGWQSRRRVRAIYDGDARRIDHYEIADMQAVIAARKAHAERKAHRAERLAAMVSMGEASPMG